MALEVTHLEVQAGGDHLVIGTVRQVWVQEVIRGRQVDHQEDFLGWVLEVVRDRPADRREDLREMDRQTDRQDFRTGHQGSLEDHREARRMDLRTDRLLEEAAAEVAHLEDRQMAVDLSRMVSTMVEMVTEMGMIDWLVQWKP